MHVEYHKIKKARFRAGLQTQYKNAKEVWLKFPRLQEACPFANIRPATFKKLHRVPGALNAAISQDAGLPQFVPGRFVHKIEEGRSARLAGGF